MGGDAAQPVTVVGAGVFGLATALALAQGGRRVRVVAETPPATTASGVAAGMLAPAFESVLDHSATDSLGLLRAARDLWPGLAGRLGVALDRSGAAAVGPDAWLANLQAQLAGLGLETLEAGRAEMDAWTPGLAPQLRRALVTPEDWRIEPQDALAAMTARILDLGGTVQTGALSERDLDDPPGPVVLATGADGRLAALAPELALLSPIKGQILWRPDRAPPGRVIRTPGAYLLGSGGGLLAGATMEAGREDLAADLPAQASLRGALAQVIPGLPPEGWETRVGVRAASPDGLPLVGPSARPGVFLAVGARRNGWLLAPLVADIVTAAVIGKDGGPWASRLDPSRFAREDEGVQT
jgi:glycine oxidase